MDIEDIIKELLKYNQSFTFIIYTGSQEVGIKIEDIEADSASKKVYINIDKHIDKEA